MTEQDHVFMRRAIEVAQAGMQAGSGGPFGAVVVKNGKIIAEAHNQVLADQDPTAHAEVLAIRRACQQLESFQLDGCVIYTSCEPCPMCLGAIYWARPRKVFFASTREEAAAIAFDDHFIYEELEKDISRRSIPFQQLPSEEARRLFQDWDDKQDKTRY
jgi:guanine deaminase